MGKTVRYFTLPRIQSLDKTHSQNCQINGVYAAPSTVTKFIWFFSAYIFYVRFELT